MSKEVTNHDVLIAVKEIANQVSGVEHQVSELSTRISGVEHQVSELGTRISGVEHQVSELSTRVSGVEHQVSELGESVNDRFVAMEKNIKEEFKKTNKKIDLFDTQLEILSSTILKTQAEVKRLQKAR